MRRIRYFIISLLLLLSVVNGGIDVLAANMGFSTEALPEDDRATVIKNLNISTLEDEPKRRGIECFDVGESGIIAIGCNTSNNKTVCIYTSDGKFQYGYSFECDGSFGIEIDRNKLLIYLVRSDIAIAVNPKGEVENISKIQNTSENNSYWNNVVFSNRRKVGDMEYALKNTEGIFSVFASSYSQLSVTDVKGEQSVIYDVSSVQFSNMVVAVICVFLFICLAVFVIIRQFAKLRHKV